MTMSDAVGKNCGSFSPPAGCFFNIQKQCWPPQHCWRPRPRIKLTLGTPTRYQTNYRYRWGRTKSEECTAILSVDTNTNTQCEKDKKNGRSRKKKHHQIKRIVETATSERKHIALICLHQRIEAGPEKYWSINYSILPVKSDL